MRRRRACPGRRPRPPEARQLGGSAYWRLPVGDWRILYEPEDEMITVLVLKVGRVPSLT
ncbi:type II toxin-antitoxin system RelE family toxin [Streptomyces yanii]|uniref:Type II toxin-antitoxin system RelE/ParE family toxin n=1 Tax=Streptomyces yanii TaxID=78510 RepID=A0ABV5R950_9ACTN